MHSLTYNLCSFLLLLTLITANPLTALSSPNPPIEEELLESIDVYIDCQTRGCFQEFIRTEATFLNFVRDQEDAHIHLIINREGTGSGREYTLRYFGQRDFDGRDNVVRFFSSDDNTTDQRRREILRRFKVGLLPYMVDTQLADFMDVHVDTSDRENDSDSNNQNGRWNYWVFEVGGSTSFNGSETRESYNLDGEFSADRITRNWKIRMEVEGNYEYNWFELSDGRTTTTEVRDQSFEGLFVRAISPHFSVGMFTEAASSTYDNYDLRLEASPAIEYNFFNYSEYGERELRMMYRVAPSYTDYIEETIYEQQSEFLYNHRLSLDLDLNRRWGRIRSSVSTSHYLHDFDMNRVNFFTRLDLRLYRGLSLNLRGSYNIISDQLSIPAGDVSDEDVLLDIREQATAYSYWGRVGISYTFGSIYNNIVNPRF